MLVIRPLLLVLGQVVGYTAMVDWFWVTGGCWFCDRGWLLVVVGYKTVVVGSGSEVVVGYKTVVVSSWAVLVVGCWLLVLGQGACWLSLSIILWLVLEQRVVVGSGSEVVVGSRTGVVVGSGTGWLLVLGHRVVVG